jgi:hypothetical protein
MKALQRINTGTFLVGFLGFLSSYILDLVAAFKPGAKQASRVTRLVLRAVSPHFALARRALGLRGVFSQACPEGL